MTVIVQHAGGIRDHGLLTGLSDDDHLQYHNDVRGDARYIRSAIVDSKGDLIAATSADTVSRFAAGTNNQVLSANSAQATGLEWITLTTALISEGSNLYFTDERAQDAVGTILTDTSTINFTYNDAGNLITADVIAGGISHNALANLTTGDPHTQYITLTPTTDARNVIQPSAATVTPFIVRGFTSQSDNLTEWQNSGTTVIGLITKDGYAAFGTNSTEGYGLRVKTVAVADDLLFKFSVADAANDYFECVNGTSTSNVFSPIFRGVVKSSTAVPAVQFLGQIAAGVDSGTEPVVRFMAQTDTSPNTVSTRPLFAFLNQSTTVLTIGSAGTATFTPSSASTKGIIVKGFASHTANLTEWQNSSSSVLLSVAAGGHLTFGEGINIIAGTATGTKLGTSTSQKISLWNATPIVQPTGIADADGTLADITTKFNSLLSKLESFGLIAVA